MNIDYRTAEIDADEMGAGEKSAGRSRDALVAKRDSGQRNKRHCMVVHAYYPLGETRVEREAVALVNHGYEVDVICLQDDGEAATDKAEGVTIYRLPVQRSKRPKKQHGLLTQLIEYFTFLLLASIKLIGLHWRQRYGAIQTHNLPDFLVFVALIPKLFGARVILDLHDLMPEFFAARSNRGMESLAVRLVIWQEQLSCRFADHVITVTDVWRQTLIRRGVPSHKVSVVMNVADSAIFHPGAAKRALPGTSDQFRMIYHGTLTYRYGVDLVIQAIAKLRHEIPEIHLTLLGAGDAREELQRLTYELGLAEHVEISRQLVHASQLPQRIRQADAGVVPNRDDLFTGTLLPTKLLEYVALDTPVIAARTETIAAYFDDSMVKFFRPGDVDDLAQCILELHRNREQLRMLAQNAGKFSQKYSWTTLSQEYVATVDRLQPAEGVRA